MVKRQPRRPRIENKATFVARIRSLKAPSEVYLIMSAYDKSKEKHRHQVRKFQKDPQGKPLRYFEHPRSAVLICIDEIRCVDVVCALYSSTA